MFERRAAAPAGIALTAFVVLACVLWLAPVRAAAAQRGYARIQPACPAPGPGEATCFALGRVRVPASEAGKPGVRPLAAVPSAVEFGPAKGLTPALLESAYGFKGASGGEGQTVAIVDAFDDPKIEGDLAEFSNEYGLPECTTANGCFRKVNQNGLAAPLPAADKQGWSVEISLDVEMVHGACPKCRILLLESENALTSNLAKAAQTAAVLGATEISNSYGGLEDGPPTALETAAYDHAGIVIAAATGDEGYDGWEELPEVSAPNVPASMPSVVSVGGTTLDLDEEGRREAEQVWSGSGGGCSFASTAPSWQRLAPGFAATGCGTKRLNADVAAVGDPATGFDVYDTYDCGSACKEFKGSEPWSTIGGTSVGTPLITALYALAGGARGIAYPALTVYSHLGDSSLFDVTQGANGACGLFGEGGQACGVNAEFGKTVDCEGTTACNAAPGYDGPSGVGTPNSLEAFQPVADEEEAAKRRAEEAAAAEAAAKRAAEEAAAKRAAEEAARRAAEEAAAKAKAGQGFASFKAAKAAVPAATLRGSSLHVGRRGSVTVRISCPPGASRCEGTVRLRTLTAVIARPGAHASLLTLASGRFTVAGGHVTTVRLRLSARARALLASRGRLRVRVVILAHDPAGASHAAHATATLYAFRRR
jgi:hypothetical protein